MLKYITMIILVSSLYSTDLLAVGLGQHHLISAHNQPLDAKIQLLSTDGYNANEFQVKLASADEFAKKGIEYSQDLNDIRFEVIKDHQNGMFIQLSSYNSIKEPTLNLLIELTWPRGQIIREFNFLLDVPALQN